MFNLNKMHTAKLRKHLFPQNKGLTNYKSYSETDMHVNMVRDWFSTSEAQITHTSEKVKCFNAYID